MNIELFPCSGGFAAGFRRVGITFEIIIEKDADACESYERNHGHRPLQMDVNDFATMVRSGWRPASEIEFMLMDPPCTPWSRAGKREGTDDERDCLEVSAELIALLRPRAALIGNVPGLQDSTSWGVVQRVIGGLAAHGYCVVDYVCLDAADFGVPQHRVRPFWFVHREGPCIRWPAPTYGSPLLTSQTTLDIAGAHLAPWVSCRQALQHLPVEELGRPVRMRIRDKGGDGTRHGGDVTRCSAPDKPATTVVAKDARKGGQILIPGEHALGSAKQPWIPKGGDESMCSAPDKPAATVGAHEGIKGGQVLLANDKHPMSSLDRPALGITERLGATGSAIGGAALYVGELVRDPNDTRKANLSTPDEPAYTLTRNTHSEGATLFVGDTQLTKGRGARPQSQRVLSPDEPATTVSTKDNRGANGAVTLEWPWNRPATTVFAGDRIMPPGHHDGSNLSGPNAVILSARAAAILQGFPDRECDASADACDAADARPGATCPACGRTRRWHFTGATKKAVWSQLGQAMPPGLAEPVARAIAEQMRAARAQRAA